MLPETHPFPRRPALLFAAWALWLSCEYWGFGPFSYLFIHDNADQVLPFIAWITRSPAALLRDPLVPVLGGIDRFSGTAWLAAHHPFFLAFPPWLAHGLFILLQRFLAGYFTFRLARDAMKLPAGPALLAGLAYPLVQAENGEMRLMHVFNEPGFPLLVWAFWRLPSGPRAIPGALALSLFIGLGMGAVDAMPFFIPVAYVAAWLLREDTRTPGGWLVYTAWITGICLLALPWKIPGLLALAGQAATSHRADWEAGLGWRAGLRQLAAARLPWLAGWWFALAAALAWLLPFWRWRTRRDAALAWLLFSGLLLGPLTQTLAWTLSEHLGPLNGVNWFRFDRTGPLALLLAAAAGLARLFAPRDAVPEPAPAEPSARARVALGLVAGLILHDSWTTKSAHLAAVKAGQHWQGVFANAEVAKLAATAAGQPVRVATAGAFHAFHPMYNLAHGLECADGYAVLYPQRYQRYWRDVLAPLLARDPNFGGHFVAWGSRAYLFHSQVADQESRADIPFADWYNLDLLSLANVRYIVSRKPVTDPRLTPVPPAWDEARRDAWAALPPARKLRDYAAGTHPGSRAFVYENNAALPRCFFTPGARAFPDVEALHRELASRPLAELSRTAFLLAAEGDVPPDAPPASATVTMGPYAPAEFEVTADAGAAGWLVCSNTLQPGWRCEIDGKPAPIRSAYGAFMAVRLEPGVHRVRWTYRSGNPLAPPAP